MSPRWLFFLLLLPCAGLRAQPGGGGGIGFRQLYGQVGHQLVPLSWPAARARVFVFPRGQEPHGPATPIAYEDYTPRWDKLERPVRLLLIHLADTMVLDLDHLPSPNGAGYFHLLDSLVVLPGYFHYADTVRLRAFTPHTVARLVAHHQLVYQPHAQLDFLAANQLGAPYYLALSQQQLFHHQPVAALATLHTAEARQPTLAQAPLTAARRSRAYQQVGDYATAVRWVTQALALAQHFPRPAGAEATYEEEEVTALYRQRQHLYLLQRNYRAALADYDSLAADRARQSYVDERAATPAIDRALFQADSLRQPAAYALAAHLLRARLPATPAPAWPCEQRLRLEQRYYVTATAPAYFRLGLAEYRAHQLPAAFQHWRLALAEGQAYEQGTTYVAHFDSLLARWPQQPLLWVSRAIAQLHYSLGASGVAQPGNYRAALLDLDRAEQLGYTSAEVNYYRALAWQALARWEDMRRQVELALAKAPQAGELYFLRYEARVQLHEATWGNPADPDLRAYHRLCPAAR